MDPKGYPSNEDATLCSGTAAMTGRGRSGDDTLYGGGDRERLHGGLGLGRAVRMNLLGQR
jgi:Ca2+-binding RTX toxin-like protein